MGWNLPYRALVQKAKKAVSARLSEENTTRSLFAFFVDTIPPLFCCSWGSYVVFSVLDLKAFSVCMYFELNVAVEVAAPTANRLLRTT